MRFAVLLISLIALAAAFAAQEAAAPSEAIVTILDFDEPVSAILFGDADGDGLQDAALLVGRRVRVHRARRDGSFAKESDIIIKLPAGAVAVDVGPLDPRGATRAHAKSLLLVAGARGIAARALDAADAPFIDIPLPEVAGPLAARAAGGQPISMMLRADFDNDGAPELLLPTARGVAVFKQSGGSGWRLLGVAEVAVEVNNSAGAPRPGEMLKQTFELPRVAAVEVYDSPGKLRRLLAITRDSDAWVYRAGEDNLALVQHLRGRYRVDHEDRFREIRGTRRNEDINDRAVGFLPADLNNDGIPDFLSSRFSDGRVFITIGRWGEFMVEAPTRAIDVDGWVVPAQARDLNKDGRPDLVVPRIDKLGIAAALKALLSRKITLELWVFKNTATPRIVSESPDWKHSFELEILLGGDEGKFSVTARIVAGFLDFDADGLADFATLKGKDKLAVYRGNSKDIFDDVPAVEINIPSIEPWPELDFRASDLNGDGREDFLILYGSNKKGAKNKLALTVWRPRGK